MLDLIFLFFQYRETDQKYDIGTGEGSCFSQRYQTTHAHQTLIPNSTYTHTQDGNRHSSRDLQALARAIERLTRAGLFIEAIVLQCIPYSRRLLSHAA